MVAKNDITNDALRSKPSNDNYRNSKLWENIERDKARRLSERKSSTVAAEDATTEPSRDEHTESAGDGDLLLGCSGGADRNNADGDEL